MSFCAIKPLIGDKMKSLALVTLLALKASSVFAIHGELNISESIVSTNGIVGLNTYDNDGVEKLFCSGSIIDSNRVLTAAHCFDSYDFKSRPLFILYKGQKYFADSVQINSNYLREDIYDPDWGYLYEIKITGDFALIHFQRTFQPKDFINLPQKLTPLTQGSEVLFAGFGQIANMYGTGRGEGTLRFSKIVKADDVSNDRIRVEEGRSGLCLGDSGGPTFIQDDNNKVLQVGVNSQADCYVLSMSERISLDKLQNATYSEHKFKRREKR